MLESFINAVLYSVLRFYSNPSAAVALSRQRGAASLNIEL
jgi:hypothetical protein